MNMQDSRHVTVRLNTDEDLDMFDYVIVHYSKGATPTVPEIFRQLIRAEYKRLKEKELTVL